jgi:hypothetical protein
VRRSATVSRRCEQAVVQANGGGRAPTWADVEPKGGDAVLHKVRTRLVCAISAARGMVMPGLRPHRADGCTAAPGPGHGPSAKQGGGLDQMVEAGADARVVPGGRRKPARAAEVRARRPTFFTLLANLGPAALVWSLWNPVAVDAAPAAGGARRGGRGAGAWAQRRCSFCD